MEMDQLDQLIKNLTDIKEILEKGKVIELRPALNAQHKSNERARQKEQGKDPLHQPAKNFKDIHTTDTSKFGGGKRGHWVRDQGVSEAGAHVRSHKPDDPSFFLEMDHAKSKHKRVLENIKKQPKPNLTKEEVCKIADNGQWSIEEQ